MMDELDDERYTLTPKGVATAKEAIRLFGEGISFMGIVDRLDLGPADNDAEAELYVRMLVTIAEMQGVLD